MNIPHPPPMLNSISLDEEMSACVCLFYLCIYKCFIFLLIFIFFVKLAIYDSEELKNEEILNYDPEEIENRDLRALGFIIIQFLPFFRRLNTNKIDAYTTALKNVAELMLSAGKSKERSDKNNV